MSQYCGLNCPEILLSTRLEPKAHDIAVPTAIEDLCIYDPEIQLFVYHAASQIQVGIESYAILPRRLVARHPMLFRLGTCAETVSHIAYSWCW